MVLAMMVGMKLFSSSTSPLLVEGEPGKKNKEERRDGRKEEEGGKWGEMTRDKTGQTKEERGRSKDKGGKIKKGKDREGEGRIQERKAERFRGR